MTNDAVPKLLTGDAMVRDMQQFLTQMRGRRLMVRAEESGVSVPAVILLLDDERSTFVAPYENVSPGRGSGDHSEGAASS